MLPTNEDIRDFLINRFGVTSGHAIVLYPEYADAFEGISRSSKVIYSYNKAVHSFAIKHHVTIDEAKLQVSKDLLDWEGISNSVKVNYSYSNAVHSFALKHQMTYAEALTHVPKDLLALEDAFGNYAPIVNMGGIECGDGDRLTNDKIRDCFIEHFGREKGCAVKLYHRFWFADAFEGISNTDKAIYNLHKMAISISHIYQVSIQDAERLLEIAFSALEKDPWDEEPIVNMCNPFNDD